MTPRHSGALDDRAFAGHATFAWRAATQVLAGPGGGRLRYMRHRPTATFGAMGRGLRPGDRITRCWDATAFEVAAVHREGGRVCCELVELDARLH